MTHCRRKYLSCHGYKPHVVTFILPGPFQFIYKNTCKYLNSNVLYVKCLHNILKSNYTGLFLTYVWIVSNFKMFKLYREYFYQVHYYHVRRNIYSYLRTQALGYKV